MRFLKAGRVNETAPADTGRGNAPANSNQRLSAGVAAHAVVQGTNHRGVAEGKDNGAQRNFRTYEDDIRLKYQDRPLAQAGALEEFRILMEIPAARTYPACFSSLLCSDEVAGILRGCGEYSLVIAAFLHPHIAGQFLESGAMTISNMDAFAQKNREEWAILNDGIVGTALKKHLKKNEANAAMAARILKHVSSTSKTRETRIPLIAEALAHDSVVELLATTEPEFEGAKKRMVEKLYKIETEEDAVSAKEMAEALTSDSVTRLLVRWNGIAKGAGAAIMPFLVREAYRGTRKKVEKMVVILSNPKVLKRMEGIGQKSSPKAVEKAAGILALIAYWTKNGGIVTTLSGILDPDVLSIYDE